MTKADFQIKPLPPSIEMHINFFAFFFYNF